MTRTATDTPAAYPAAARVGPVSPLQQVLAHAERAEPSCGPVRVVAIDGRSGAGKTSLGREVAAAWAATLVSMDSIYRGWDGLADAVPLLVEHVLRPLSRGEAAEVPTWNWSLDRSGPVIPLGSPARLVVEGCGASVGEAGRYAGTRVWLELDAAERKERALARDGEVFARQWDRWAAQEERLFTADGTAGRAHLVLGS